MRMSLIPNLFKYLPTRQKLSLTISGYTSLPHPHDRSGHSTKTFQNIRAEG
jgi:hypothetical protein